MTPGLTSSRLGVNTRNRVIERETKVSDKITEYVTTQLRNAADNIEEFSKLKVQDLTFQIAVSEHDGSNPSLIAGSTSISSWELRKLMLQEAMKQIP